MTGIKKRSPTNKEFKKNFQGLASTQVKKGHLGDKKDKKSEVTEGTLIRVNRKKYDSNGWEVKVGTGKSSATYMCFNLDYEIPPFTESGNYLVFSNVKVDLLIDKKNKIYQITRIKSTKKHPLVWYNDKLVLSADTNENTKSAVQSSIEITEDSINLNSDDITITDSNNNITNLSDSLNKLETENSNLQDQVSSLMQRIEIIEENNT